MAKQQTSASSLKESKEYKACEKFFASKEFKSLTQGDAARFKNFDKNNPDDLHAMRDYLSQRSNEEFTDYKSITFCYYQIGKALEIRELYKELDKQNESRSLHKTPTATTGRYKSLGRYDTSIKLGVGHKASYFRR